MEMYRIELDVEARCRIEVMWLDDVSVPDSDQIERRGSEVAKCVPCEVEIARTD